VAVPDFEGICANTTFVLEPREPSELLREFLPFVMQAEAFNEHSIKQSKGSVNPYVNFSDLAWYEFPLPPIAEQERLARTLTGATEALGAFRDAQTAIGPALRACLIHLLQDAERTGEARTIDTLGDVLMGRQLAPRYLTGSHPTKYLRVANVGELEMLLDEVRQMDFAPRDFDRYHLMPDDILVTEGDIVNPRNVGRPVIFTGEIADCCFQNTLIRFRPSPQIYPRFGMYVLEALRLRGDFAKAGKKTTVTHLGARRFSQTRIPVPTLAVQQAAAEPLDELLAARRALREREALAKRIHREALHLLEL
jgi:type I restriction enzyme S subunit